VEVARDSARDDVALQDARHRLDQRLALERDDVRAACL
jgi:hypothetical protein